MGHVEELRVMLEMLAGGLHRVDNVRGGKLCAMVAGHADEQTLDQSELCSQERELPGQRSWGIGRGLDRSCTHFFAAKGEPAADNCVHQEVFQDVRVAVKERRVVAVVRM
jgi:hypothetical protein